MKISQQKAEHQIKKIALNDPITIIIPATLILFDKTKWYYSLIPLGLEERGTLPNGNWIAQFELIPFKIKDPLPPSTGSSRVALVISEASSACHWLLG